MPSYLKNAMRLAERGLGQLYPEGAAGFKAAPGAAEHVVLPGIGKVQARPIEPIQSVASQYMANRGMAPHREGFVPINPAFSSKVAEAYGAMAHDPRDPAVRRAYEALTEETMDQLRAAEPLGIKYEFSTAHPSHRSPALGYSDLVNRGRLAVFPTEAGFGTAAGPADNPLLKPIGRLGNNPNAVVNDAFRIVHDLYGHYGPGNPFFRAPGEERAFQLHSQMYSPEALPAAASETRGQNSWVNYGPHGEQNRVASPEDTIFAEQKSGIMPAWTHELPPSEGADVDAYIEGLKSKRRAEGGDVEGNEPVMREYKPSLKERIANYVMGDARPSPERRQFAQGVSDLAYYVPGVGEAIAGDLIGRRAAEGDYGAAARAAMGVIPGAGRMAGSAAQRVAPNAYGAVVARAPGGAIKAAMRMLRSEGPLARNPVYGNREDFKYASGGGAWTRSEGKNPEGGLNAKGRASLKAQGHDIKRPQPEGGARRDSFCARMKGMKAKLTSKETASDPDSRINKSLRAWNCADGGAIRPALGAGGDIVKAAQRIIKAYHTSPHKFDRFDISKIGTGEGNQVFGHGLYFAENPKVGGQGGAYWDMFHKRMKAGTSAEMAASALRANNFDKDAAAAALRRMQSAVGDLPKDPGSEEGYKMLADHYGRSAKYLDRYGRAGPYTYEVQINEDPNKFLDWDQPLRDQSPIIQGALGPLAESGARTVNEARARMAEKGKDFMGRPYSPERMRELQTQLDPMDLTGQNLHTMTLKELGAHAPDQFAAEGAQQLLDKGVAGIRYLDQGSRFIPGGTDGTRNYVTFSDKPVEILNRYAGGGAIRPALGAGGDIVKAAQRIIAARTAAESPHIIAYHGSPHSFDHFDISKVGTGEGAQAYGHGLYFADNEDVARQYRDALSSNVSVAGKPTGSTGSMYQVRINADPEHFLDWDKPLGEQPHIAGQMENSVYFSPERSGQNFYGDMMRGRYRQAEREGVPVHFLASEYLQNRGIPGIKYLDQGSRSAGEGSRNYVVFDPEMIDILRKYARGGEVDPVHSAMRLIDRMHRDVGGDTGPGDDSFENSGSMMAGYAPGRPQKSAHEFVQQELAYGEPQLPQYDPEAGKETAMNALEAAKMAGYMTPAAPYIAAADFAQSMASGSPVDAALASAFLPGGKYAKMAGAALASQASPDAAEASPVDAAMKLARRFVKDPVRVTRPDIYKMKPSEMAQIAESRVAPESPALKQLFGVTRGEMNEIAGNRPGTAEPSIAMKPNPRGSAAAENVMTPRNASRLIDILGEASKQPNLSTGMRPWYYMDPAYHRMVELMGPEKAEAEYARLNNTMGVFSPGAEVPTEINRGAAAYHLGTPGNPVGTIQDFIKYGGNPPAAPESFRRALYGLQGHMYHSTSHGGPLQKYYETGAHDMKSPKVPLYIQASGAPGGFQTTLPVPDAHFTRIVGLPDTRTARTQGSYDASMRMPEFQGVGPWWRDKVAKKAGMEAVPAQALIWGAGSHLTGVETPIGAPKLELLANHLMRRAAHHGISPEKMRDLFLTGQAYRHGGKVEGALRLAHKISSKG